MLNFMGAASGAPSMAGWVRKLERRPYGCCCPIVGQCSRRELLPCCAETGYSAQMTPKSSYPIDADHGPPGPYDPPETAGDHWFLPTENDDGDAGPVGALPRAPHEKALIDGAPWRAAEAALAPDLAALAFDQGRLAERVAAMGQGAVQRLAQSEAASLSWWTGDRIPADRLALWQAFRIGAAGADGEGLIRTAWAARRLMAPVSEAGMQLASVLAQVLGGDDRRDPAVLADVAGVIEDAGALHPVTRGAALFHLWRALDERPDHLRGLEAAVLAARLAAGQGRALPFLPLALTGFGGLSVSGTLERRLAGWIVGAHAAVLAALLELDRLTTWRSRAEQEAASLSGRTPARLIACLAAHPMIAAPQAEVETGASRAAVQRNIDLFAARGLVREVTGQGRFRVWAAKL